MKKTLFVFNIQSISDVITNSSSELFVFDNKNTVAEVIAILDSIYPNWSTEYNDPVLLRDADDEEVETYFDYSMAYSDIEDYGTYYREEDGDPIEYAKKKAKTYKAAITKFLKKNWNLDVKFSDFYKDADDCYKKFLPHHMEQFRGSLNMWWYPQITDSGLSMLREKNDNRILLFSKDENPNWDYQEKLMEVAERYHLG